MGSDAMRGGSTLPAVAATPGLLLLYAGCVAAIALTARLLSRPLPAVPLAVAAILPVFLLAESFFTDRTPLPLDHARALAPWRVAGTPAAANPDVDDVALQFLPWAKATRLALKAGELPWRNRWSGCGTPLAANAQSGALSPFTLLGLLLPLARAFTLIAAVKILLAAAGTWLLARELSISPHAALFAATATSLSFAMTAWLLFPHSAVLCLAPWMLFLLELSRDPAQTRRALAALTVCFVAMFLAGHPETLVLAIGFAALWILGRRFAGSLPEGFPLLARAAGSGVLAAGLVAWLLLPELAAIRASNRLESLGASAGPAYLTLAPHLPVTWGPVITSVFPHAFGSSVGSPLVAGAASVFPELASGYAGILAILLALLILRPGSPRRREELVLVTLVLLALCVAAGQWPIVELFARLPWIGHISTLRPLIWLALSVPLLAAFELDRLAADAASRRGARLAPVLALIVVALGGAALFVWSRLESLHRAAGGLDFQRAELALVVVALAAGGLGAALLLHRPRTLAAILVGVTAAELLRGGRSLYPPFPSSWMYPQTPLLAFVRSRPGVFRVAGAGAVLYPETPVFAGLEDVRTHDPVERRDYVDFLDATCGFAPLDYFKTLRDLDAPALDFLNVRYLLTAPGQPAPGGRWKPAYADAQGAVFENPAALSRVFAPASIRFVASDARHAPDANRVFGEAFREIAATRDFRSIAYVASNEESGRRENPPVEVSAYAEGVNAASFTTRSSSSSGPAFVVASLTQDGGWSARDETGAALPVRLADGPFLAVRVPPGAHAIRLRYAPPGLAAGIGIALVSLLAAILAERALRP